MRFETYHDVTYFTPESRAAVDALGCQGSWMGYFGMRSAPLGATSPELVTATFYNFHPKRVALVMFGADHELDPRYQQAQRGWSAAEWAVAARGLAGHGLLTEQGKLTEKGAELRRWVEQRTDEEAAAPWLSIGAEASARAADLLTPIATRIADANAATEVNPMAIVPVVNLSPLAAEMAAELVDVRCLCIDCDLGVRSCLVDLVWW